MLVLECRQVSANAKSLLRLGNADVMLHMQLTNWCSTTTLLSSLKNKSHT